MHGDASGVWVRLESTYSKGYAKCGLGVLLGLIEVDDAPRVLKFTTVVEEYNMRLAGKRGCRGRAARDVESRAPPAQIPASGITALGSYLGYLTPKRWSG